MRTCQRKLLLFFLFVWLSAALPAGAESPPQGEEGENGEEEEICGDGYHFQIAGPEGWQVDREEAQDGVSLIYTPANATVENSPIALAVTLPLGPARTPQVDLDRVLDERVATLALFGDPRVIRNASVAHASLETRSVMMELPAGVLHLSLIDAHSGEGDYFVASLVKQGSASTPAEQASFQKTIDSLVFDPSRSCEAEGTSAKIVKRTSSFPASPDPSTDSMAPATADADAALQRAFSGCHAIQQMLVPVTCARARVAGESALVLTFEDGTEPAEVYLERFRDRIAGTYCWAVSAATLPPLFFRSQSEAKGLSKLREYSCQSRGWGRSLTSAAYSAEN